MEDFEKGGSGGLIYRAQNAERSRYSPTGISRNGIVTYQRCGYNSSIYFSFSLSLWNYTKVGRVSPLTSSGVSSANRDGIRWSVRSRESPSGRRQTPEEAIRNRKRVALLRNWIYYRLEQGRSRESRFKGRKNSSTIPKKKRGNFAETVDFTQAKLVARFATNRKVFGACFAGGR